MKGVYCSSIVIVVSLTVLASAYAQIDNNTILYYSFDRIVDGKIPDEAGGYDGEPGGDATITKNSGAMALSHSALMPPAPK